MELTVSAGMPPATEPYRTRTWVLFASAAPVAVVLRRGPKRHWRMILWHLADDTFTLGQWMTGIVTLSDLSPDGSRLLYRAAQFQSASRLRRRAETVQGGASLRYDPLRVAAQAGRKPRLRRRVPRYQRNEAIAAKTHRPVTGHWTAISRPPNFTALAIWPSFGTWTGGGALIGHDAIGLYESADGLTPKVNVPLPESISIVRLEAAAMSAIRPSYDVTSEAWQGLIRAGAREIDWVSEHDPSALLFAAGGQIFRLPSGVEPANATCLIDVRPMAFEQIAPSAAALTW